MSELKPCPFCGSGDVAFWRIHEHGEQEGFISCKTCWADGPIEDSCTKAAESWNKRCFEIASFCDPHLGTPFE